MNNMKSQKDAWLRERFILGVTALVYLFFFLILLGLVGGMARLVFSIILP